MEGNAIDLQGHPRKGWEEQFIEMHKNGDDRMLIDDVFEDETFDTWENTQESNDNSVD